MDETGNYPELEIKVYKFDIMGYSVHCILLDSQREVMQEFFEEVSSGKVLWEEAKSKAIFNLIKLEYKNIPDEMVTKMYKSNPNAFVRTHNVFRDLESNSSIQNIIREIKINQITDY